MSEQTEGFYILLPVKRLNQRFTNITGQNYPKKDKDFQYRLKISRIDDYIDTNTLRIHEKLDAFDCTFMEKYVTGK